MLLLYRLAPQTSFLSSEMVLNILELKQKRYNDLMHILHLSDTGTILVKQADNIESTIL